MPGASALLLDVRQKEGKKRAQINVLSSGFGG